MQIDISFKHPDDNKYWALFSNSESMFDFIQDLDDILKEGQTLSDKDFAFLKKHTSEIIAKIQEQSNKE